MYVPGPSCRGVLAGLPHTTGLGFQTGHPDRRVLVVSHEYPALCRMSRPPSKPSQARGRMISVSTENPDPRTRSIYSIDYIPRHDLSGAARTDCRSVGMADWAYSSQPTSQAMRPAHPKRTDFAAGLEELRAQVHRRSHQEPSTSTAPSLVEVGENC